MVSHAIAWLTADALLDFSYHPSHPPNPDTTSLHLSLLLPPRSTVDIRIPYTKLTLKYTEHRPDAERGIEIPSGVLTLLDVRGEGPADGVGVGQVDPARTGRRHVYTFRCPTTSSS